MHRTNTYSPVFTMVMCCIGFQSSSTCWSKIISYLAVVSLEKERNRDRDFIHTIDKYSEVLTQLFCTHIYIYSCFALSVVFVFQLFCLVFLFFCFCFVFCFSFLRPAVQVMPASAALSSASKVCLHHSSGPMPFVPVY